MKSKRKLKGQSRWKTRYTCEEPNCGHQVVNNIQHFRRHIVKDHLNGLKLFQCTLCQKSFYTKYDLDVHYNRHLNGGGGHGSKSSGGHGHHHSSNSSATVGSEAASAASGIPHAGPLLGQGLSIPLYGGGGGGDGNQSSGVQGSSNAGQGVHQHQLHHHQHLGYLGGATQQEPLPLRADHYGQQTATQGQRHDGFQQTAHQAPPAHEKKKSNTHSQHRGGSHSHHGGGGSSSGPAHHSGGSGGPSSSSGATTSQDDVIWALKMKYGMYEVENAIQAAKSSDESVFMKFVQFKRTQLLSDKQKDGRFIQKTLYTCEEAGCGHKVINNIHHFRRHVIRDHLSGLKLFGCEFCTKSFHTKYDLGRHYIRHQKQGKNYPNLQQKVASMTSSHRSSSSKVPKHQQAQMPATSTSAACPLPSSSSAPQSRLAGGGPFTFPFLA